MPAPREKQMADPAVVNWLLEGDPAIRWQVLRDLQAALLAHVMQHKMADGGWNCRCTRDRHVVHSSFHTTFNVLDGLQDQLDRGGPLDRRAIQAAQARATEFMLAHKLFRSDKTNAIISEH